MGTQSSGGKRVPKNAPNWWTQGESRLHRLDSHLLNHKAMDKAFNHNNIWIKVYPDL